MGSALEWASILEEALGFCSDFWFGIMFSTAYGRCFGGGLGWFCVRETRFVYVGVGLGIFGDDGTLRVFETREL